MPHEKADRLIISSELGEKQMKDCVKKRFNTNEVNFWEPLPDSNLKHLGLFQKKEENQNCRW